MYGIVRLMIVLPNHFIPSLVLRRESILFSCRKCLARKKLTNRSEF